MFRISFILLIIFIFSGCQKENVSKESLIRNIEKNSVKNSMKIPAKPEGLKGKIEIYENNPEVYFVLNWESKSRITYRVLNPDEFNLKEMKDRILKLEGKIKKFSQWSGEIEVLRIIEVEN